MYQYICLTTPLNYKIIVTSYCAFYDKVMLPLPVSPVVVPRMPKRTLAPRLIRKRKTTTTTTLHSFVQVQNTPFEVFESGDKM